MMLQVARIQSLDNKHPVKIDVEKGVRLNRIRIQGLADTCVDVMQAIYKIFREVDQEKQNKMQSDLILKEVSSVL